MSKRSKTSMKFLLAISIYLCLFSTHFFTAQSGAPHEPITTKVMFNRDIIRILERNCLGCHAQGKFKADIPLTTYEETRPWAKAIKEEILERRMGPYQAVKGYGNFVHDYGLTQRDIELMISWIDGGAPRGEPKDYPASDIRKLIAGREWPLGEPDLILEPEQEIKIDPEKGDVAKCLSLPTGLKTNRYLSAIDFQPGNGSIVYNANFAIESKPNGAACDAGDPSFAQWSPNQPAARFPTGYGQLIPAGSNILLRIGYRPRGEQAVDRSRIGLYFSREPVNKAVRSVKISPAAKVSIPANDAAFRTQATLPIEAPMELISIRPLLFPLATSIEATMIRPDGSSEVLIWARDYRFDWQPSFFFKSPIAAPRGARIEITAYFDNSEQNRNHPQEAPAPISFQGPLCELTVVTGGPAAKPARRTR
jgi:hypothetical protein